MSFDLFFCSPKNEKVNFDDVERWAESIEYFKRNETQLWYANPDTGVYFSIDFASDDAESPDDAPLIPDGYFDSGLSFNLNYNRPRYFAFEAMPIVANLATRFGLGVVDPQADLDEPPLTRVADTDALVSSWTTHNESATLALIRDPDFSNPLHMVPADSLYLWRYSKAAMLSKLCPRTNSSDARPIQRTQDDPRNPVTLIRSRPSPSFWQGVRERGLWFHARASNQ